MRIVVFAFAFVLVVLVVLLSVRRKTGVRFDFFFCVFFPCFHLRVASLRNSFVDRIEYNLVLMCATRFLPFPSFSHSLYICMYMLTRIRAASGLIISCIQPPGFVGVPFMVGMLFLLHTRRHTYSGVIIGCI